MAHYGEKVVVMNCKVTHCRHGCPFFSTTMDGMHCEHPYWDGKGAYAGMIISHDDDIENGFPPRCPLWKALEV